MPLLLTNPTDTGTESTVANILPVSGYAAAVKKNLLEPSATKSL